MQYDKLPCNFNGAKVGNSAYPRVERDKSYSYKINRCTKSVTKPKNLRSYGRNGKEVTDINVPRNTPIVAMRDMEFFFAKDYSAENRCREHKKQDIGSINITLPDPTDPSKKRKCKTPYENIQVTFKDLLTGDIIVYHGLAKTTLVPGFGKGKCKVPYMHDRKTDKENNLTQLLKGARFDHICGGPIKKKVKKGEVIGFSGQRGKYSSFGFNIKKKDQPYIIAPEDNLAWENFPNDKNRFLIPVLTDSQIETMQMVFEKEKKVEKSTAKLLDEKKKEKELLIVKNKSKNFKPPICVYNIKEVKYIFKNFKECLEKPFNTIIFKDNTTYDYYLSKVENNIPKNIKSNNDISFPICQTNNNYINSQAELAKCVGSLQLKNEVILNPYIYASESNYKSIAERSLLSKNKDEDLLKSAIKIKDKVKYLKGNNTAYFQYIYLKLNDLRGHGFVYYIFDGNKYYRVDQDFKVISTGSYKYTEKSVFELKENDQKYFWKISLSSEVVDIKSKFYDFKGYKRFEFTQAHPDEQTFIRDAINNFESQKYAEIDESDDNLNRLYKLIMEDEYFLKKNKYLKYSKKGQYNGKKIKSMGLAVFINYDKELSKLTKDIYLKKISPFAWGWEYSYEDKLDFTGWKAIQKCYAHVKKRKLKYTDGECIVVDFRRITNDSQYPVAWENHLFKERENRILIAKKTEESQKSKDQLAKEDKAKKELLAKKKRSRGKRETVTFSSKKS